MTKIINFSDYQKQPIIDEINDILFSLADEYELLVKITEEEVLKIVDLYFKLYYQKKITYQLEENLLAYFNDFAIWAVENDAIVDINSLLTILERSSLFSSPTEITPQDTKKLLIKIKNRK